ncbi:HAD-like protein [Periconia macrospinosa]|uniref:HAD-like protein n=1 Tax=Periconia macrospinosa TaxID=97972 RepID=A0A2V1E423_9PLEO|nr:HAD-like protein [Periconia macrospinosa]
MSKLTSFKLLSFDVYGTLIDYERGALKALEPMFQKSGNPDLDQKHVMKLLHNLQAKGQVEKPRQLYCDLLESVHPILCKELGLAEPTKEESKAFGASIPLWPAWPDTVDALRRLKKVYKMVVLSNVDNASFEKNNAASLDGFEWDAVLTAEDIGKYKPCHDNFHYMLREAKNRFGVEKDEVLQTAQSQFHDHHPAKELGIKSSWIWRPGAVAGNRYVRAASLDVMSTNSLLTRR